MINRPIEHVAFKQSDIYQRYFCILCLAGMDCCLSANNMAD